MPEGGSHYAISKFLLTLLEETGLSRSEFVQSLGYRNVERGRRRLDPWIDEGTGFYKILHQIEATYPNHAERLETALTSTKAVKAAEDYAEFFDLCKAQESTFTPFIYAEGESRIPNGITLFGVTGGHEAWTIIKIPKRILDLSLDDQLSALPKLMEAYRQKFDGAVPFFGRLTGFRFVRLLDHYRFDVEGNLIEHVEKPFRLGACWVELR